MEKKMHTTSNADEMVTISRAEYEELLQLREENAQLTKMNEWFREQITLAKHNRFGSKADTVSEDTYGQLSLLFDEAEVTAWMEAKLEKSPVAAHKYAQCRVEECVGYCIDLRQKSAA